MLRRVALPLTTMAAVPAGLVVFADGNSTPPPAGQVSRKMKANQLPLYGEPSESPVELLPEEVSLFTEKISTVRKAVWEYMDSIRETTDKIKEKYEIGKAHTLDALHYIQEDSGALPRAGIITVAGLGGLVAGYRGGALRKAFYASVGMTTAASICYPHQAVDIVSGQWDNVRHDVKQKWRESFPGGEKKITNFPVPTTEKSEVKSESKKPAEHTVEPPNMPKEKTTKVTKLSAGETKKDYGQSKPEDKDMYTTRES